MNLYRPQLPNPTPGKQPSLSTPTPDSDSDSAALVQSQNALANVFSNDCENDRPTYSCDTTRRQKGLITKPPHPKDLVSHTNIYGYLVVSTHTHSGEAGFWSPLMLRILPGFQSIQRHLGAMRSATSSVEGCSTDCCGRSNAGFVG